LTLSGLGFTPATTEASTSISENNEKINKVENKIINSSKKINDINLDIDVLENALDENNKEIKKVKKEVENFEDEIDKTKKEIEERNEILKERLSSYQKDGGEVGFMEVIFGSVSFEDFISRYTAVNEITKADNELIKIQKEAMDKVETKQKEIEEKLSKRKEA